MQESTPSSSLGPFELFLLPPLQLEAQQVGERTSGTQHQVWVDYGKAPPLVAVSSGSDSATLPSRKLLSFALPARVELTEANFDRPVTVAFCLTGAQGKLMFGCSMTVLQEEFAIWGVVVLSCWPLVEVYKALLHSLYACRELYGLGLPTGEVSEKLASFVERAQGKLTSLADALHFVDDHPLWCGVSLQPLFRALQWDAVECAYLMLCLLTDQRVLLYGTQREQLYPAAAALKSLIAPMNVAGIFIPYLPSALLTVDEADTLINGSVQPYLIGCERDLIDALPRLSAELVVVNLDTGTITESDLQPNALARAALVEARSVREMCTQLQEGMGDCMRFKPAQIRAACLGFILGVCDVFGGSLASTSSSALRDTAAADALRMLGELSSEIATQFGRTVQDVSSRDALQRAVRTAQASLFPRLAANLMSEHAAKDDVMPLLELIWKSMPFNVWWQDKPETGVIPHLLQHRSERATLQECAREHLHSLSLVESQVQEALQTIFADLAAIPSAPDGPPRNAG